MSEPIFEASVRLRADVGDFEQQSQAAIKDVVARLESQTAQAVQAARQQFAQIGQQIGPQGATGQAVAPVAEPVKVPAEIVPPTSTPPYEGAPLKVPVEFIPPQSIPPAQVPPVEVPMELVPPTSIPPVETTTAQVPMELVPPTTIPPVEFPPVEVPTALQPPVVPPIEVTPVEVPVTVEAPVVPPVTAAPIEVPTEVVKPFVPATEAAPITVPTEVEQPIVPPTTAAPIPVSVDVQKPVVPPVEPLTVPLQTSTQLLEQQLVQARALASQPIDIELIANTEPADRAVARSYERAITLAGQQAQAMRRAAVQAAEQAEAAMDAVFAAGADRSSALITARTTQAAREAANLAAQEAEAVFRQVQSEAANVRLQPASELSTRSQVAATQAQTAGLLGDTEAQAAKQLEALVLATQSGAEAMKLQASEFIAAAGQAAGAERELLIAQAENATVAAEKLRVEAVRLQSQGLPPEVAAAGAAREGTIARILGQRSGGLAGLIGGGLRFGAIGFGLTAAFQSIQSLQKALETTGHEALTTEGRLRNVGAALVGGNIFGAIGALTREAKTVSDLGINWDNARSKLEALNQIQNGQARIQRDAANAAAAQDSSQKSLTETWGRGRAAALQSAEANETYNRTVEQAGTSNERLAAEAAAAARALLEQRRAALLAIDALVQLRDQAGAPIPAIGITLQPPAGGLVPPSQFSQQTGVTVQPGLQGFGQLSNQLAAAQRSGDLQEQKRISQRLLEIAQDRFRVVLEALRVPGLSDARKEFLNKLLVQRNQEVQSAKGVVDTVNDQIDAAAKTAHDQAEENRKKAAQAAQDRADNLAAARQQALENDIAAAALTKRKSDDRKAFAAAIAYWKGLAADAKDAKAREDAQAEVIALRKRRAEALSGKTATDTGEDVNLLRIENRIAAAQLTEGLSDDKRFTRQLIEYWRERVKNLKDDAVEREKARAQLISAQLALKNLQKQQTQGESPEVFAEALFKEAVDSFKRFGNNFSTSAAGLLSPQDVRGEFGGILTGNGQNATTVAQTQRDTMITELKKISTGIQVIANGPVKRVTGVPVPPDVGKAVAEIGGRVLAGL